ncbi:hypothetical protein B0H10DRAFT_2050822, partial [Mycena sp. CBHHK59/15]
MFYISVARGLRVEFARALRDAIFIPDPIDKARIIAWGSRQNPPLDWNTLLRFRLHGSGAVASLYPLVAAVFSTFGHLKDAKSGLPLFNASAWAVAKSVLELIQKGFLSDPPRIALYYILGVDKFGLYLYRCIRGSNYPEGGVHRHLLSHLPTSGAGIRHANASLKDFICRHNLVVGTFNSTGKRYKGHYSIWLTNELQELLSFLEDVLINPRFITGWVNGNLYQRTNEVAGVLPIPEDIRVKYAMARFEPSIDSVRPHHHLALLQGTRKAILPVHNQEEKDLFRMMMSGSNSFGNFSSDAQVDAGVRIWNAKADASDNIFYKLAEQLKVYYNSDWQRTANIIQTQSTTAQARQPLMKQIHDPNRLLKVPEVPQTTLKLHHVSAGLLSLDTVDEALSRVDPQAPSERVTRFSPSGLSSDTSAPSTIAATQFAAGSSGVQSRSLDSASQSDPPPMEVDLGISTSALSSGSSAPAIIAATEFVAGSSSGSASVSAAAASQLAVGPLSHQEALHQLAKRKVGTDLQQSEPPPKKQRKGRTCRKCAIDSCPGKGKVDYCVNDKSCVGRNAQYPTKTCKQAAEANKWNK